LKQIINYKPTKETIEEFPYVKIMPNSDVFIDLPMAAIEFGVDYKEPVLFGNYKGIPAIYEANIVKAQLKKMRLFHLKIDGEKLHEVDEKESNLKIRLPLETIVEQLIYRNGQVIWAKPVKESKEGVENGS